LGLTLAQFNPAVCLFDGDDRRAFACGAAQVTVRGIQNARLFVSLESGLRGVIEKQDFSDKVNKNKNDDELNLRDFAQVGQSITARVLQNGICWDEGVQKYQVDAHPTVLASARQASPPSPLRTRTGSSRLL
jgi:hypothetical protein